MKIDYKSRTLGMFVIWIPSYFQDTLENILFDNTFGGRRLEVAIVALDSVLSLLYNMAEENEDNKEYRWETGYEKTW